MEDHLNIAGYSNQLKFFNRNTPQNERMETQICEDITSTFDSSNCQTCSFIFKMDRVTESQSFNDNGSIKLRAEPILVEVLPELVNTYYFDHNTYNKSNEKQFEEYPLVLINSCKSELPCKSQIILKCENKIILENYDENDGEPLFRERSLVFVHSAKRRNIYLSVYTFSVSGGFKLYPSASNLFTDDLSSTRWQLLNYGNVIFTSSPYNMDPYGNNPIQKEDLSVAIKWNSKFYYNLATRHFKHLVGPFFSKNQVTHPGALYVEFDNTIRKLCFVTANCDTQMESSPLVVPLPVEIINDRQFRSLYRLFTGEYNVCVLYYNKYFILPQFNNYLNIEFEDKDHNDFSLSNKHSLYLKTKGFIYSVLKISETALLVSRLDGSIHYINFKVVRNKKGPLKLNVSTLHNIRLPFEFYAQLIETIQENKLYIVRGLHDKSFILECVNEDKFCIRGSVTKTILNFPIIAQTIILPHMSAGHIMKNGGLKQNCLVKFEHLSGYDFRYPSHDSWELRTTEPRFIIDLENKHKVRVHDDCGIREFIWLDDTSFVVKFADSKLRLYRTTDLQEVHNMFTQKLIILFDKGYIPLGSGNFFLYQNKFLHVNPNTFEETVIVDPTFHHIVSLYKIVEIQEVKILTFIDSLNWLHIVKLDLNHLPSQVILKVQLQDPSKMIAAFDISLENIDSFPFQFVVFYIDYSNIPGLYYSESHPNKYNLEYLPEFDYTSFTAAELFIVNDKFVIATTQNEIISFSKNPVLPNNKLIITKTTLRFLYDKVQKYSFMKDKRCTNILLGYNSDGLALIDIDEQEEYLCYETSDIFYASVPISEKGKIIGVSKAGMFKLKLEYMVPMVKCIEFPYSSLAHTFLSGKKDRFLCLLYYSRLADGYFICLISLTTFKVISTTSVRGKLDECSLKTIRIKNWEDNYQNAPLHLESKEVIVLIYKEVDSRTVCFEAFSVHKGNLIKDTHQFTSIESSKFPQIIKIDERLDLYDKMELSHLTVHCNNKHLKLSLKVASKAMLQSVSSYFKAKNHFYNKWDYERYILLPGAIFSSTSVEANMKVSVFIDNRKKIMSAIGSWSHNYKFISFSKREEFYKGLKISIVTFLFYSRNSSMMLTVCFIPDGLENRAIILSKRVFENQALFSRDFGKTAPFEYDIPVDTNAPEVRMEYLLEYVTKPLHSIIQENLVTKEHA